jgi:hypothetical protein
MVNESVATDYLIVDRRCLLAKPAAAGEAQRAERAGELGPLGQPGRSAAHQRLTNGQRGSCPNCG